MKIYGFIIIIFFVFTVRAQKFEREYPIGANATVVVNNLFGRVSVEAAKYDADAAEIKDEKIRLFADNAKESDLKITASNNRLEITAQPGDAKTRIDITLKIPAATKLKIETGDGEVTISGDVASADVYTKTGTIAANVPLDDVRYDFLWTESRPRFLSDVALAEVKEKAAGKFQLSGNIGEKEKGKKEEKAKKSDEDESDGENAKDKKSKFKDRKPKPVKLNFTTARGIILLNVSPNEVGSDLRERPLTNAAKAVIRSGDSLLTEAIRRASPKYFGDYAATLPPRKSLPNFSAAARQNAVQSQIKKVLVQVSDINNRAVADLRKEDFEVSESGANREVLAVAPTTAPFNLVLLLDVSGSVENYVDFIRKAARNFINTVSPNDKIAVVIFNEDVKTLSTLTTDKGRLSESLDTFDAGGGTAYYDALAFALTDTLQNLKGERTAIVVLSDGDDNRSFLAFDSLLGSIQESGALIYPLYVPSGLIAATATNDPNQAVDPLRTRYLGLTTKAENEGERLAKISGGVYYPIKKLSDLQSAYDDITTQLRTAYTVTFRSDTPEIADQQTASPRLKVKIKRPDTFVKLGSVTAVADEQSLQVEEEILPPGRRDAKEFFERISYNPANFLLKNPLPKDPPQTGEISGDVEKIKYKQFIGDTLRESKFENFDVNKSQGAFLINDGKQIIAVSRWISPKRTRSYPYERVYDTLAYSGRKVAIIPVVKDEGLGGERDFLQWDTISLLSLLDVQVILAYYDSAEKNLKRADQITKQKLDNTYILSRLQEVLDFKGTPREWNERETKQLKNVFEKAKISYQKISKETNTYLHDATALDELIKYAETPQKFIEFSRSKSRKAQNREFVTEQPKEALATDTKAKVTINNALFGRYFFTCDETKIEGKTVYLIEAKHSVRARMPNKNDIKDGFVKMMFYTNLTNVKIGAKPYNLKVQIRLTANQLKGSTNSDAKEEAIAKFFEENSFTTAETNFVRKIFEEARANNFTIILEHAETVK